MNIVILIVVFAMVVQLVRTLACHARGRGFDPHPSRFIIQLKKFG
jgi:hypothetical protein